MIYSITLRVEMWFSIGSEQLEEVRNDYAPFISITKNE